MEEHQNPTIATGIPVDQPANSSRVFPRPRAGTGRWIWIAAAAVAALLILLMAFGGSNDVAPAGNDAVVTEPVAPPAAPTAEPAAPAPSQ